MATTNTNPTAVGAPTAFPQAVKIDQIAQRHAEAALYGRLWEDLDLLYEGGERLKKNADRFLTRRELEKSDIYQVRCERLTYHNLISTILGWYLSALFRDDPAIDLKPTPAEKSREAELHEHFMKDCSRAGVSFQQMLSRLAADLLLYGRAWVLVDAPRQPQDKSGARNLAEADRMGLTRSYLVKYSPRTVTNWQHDLTGKLSWVVIEQDIQRQWSFDEEPKRIREWRVYDREHFAVYQADLTKMTANSGRNEYAQLVDHGQHALAHKGVVPVLCEELPVELWLGNRLKLPLQDHLNSDNSLSWALYMGCVLMPVIKGGWKEDPTISEASYINLPVDGDFSWSEPEGKVFGIQQERIASLREEIYRLAYLQAQGRSSAATPAAQSGYSKEMDMRPSQEILNGIGDVIRRFAARIIESSWLARRGEVEVAIRGFTFEDSASEQVLNVYERAKSARIPSETLDKHLDLTLAMQLLRDAPEDVRVQVEQEIRQAPSAEERDMARLKAMSSFAGFGAKPAQKPNSGQSRPAAEDKS